MSTVEISSYDLWYAVDTVHGDHLEHVLDRRFDVDLVSLSEQLFRMLKEEFKHDPDVRIEEYDVYYRVMIHISALTFEALQAAIPRCDAVNKRWIDHYNINELK